MLVLSLFFFSACQDQVITPVITCGDDEILVDGVCQKIKSEFELIFEATDLISSYTLDVKLQQQEHLYEMTLEVDGNKSSFAMNNQKEYYEKTNTGCKHYYPVGESYRIEEETCNAEGSSFHFFKDLEPSWFELVSQKYFMKSEFNDEVAVFFQTQFPGSTVSNLELIVGNTYIEGIICHVTVSDIMYQLSMTIKDIGQTSIVLPVVLEV